MINTLFRDQFESNLPPFIVFLALNGVLGFILTMIHVENGYMTTPVDAYHVIIIWQLVFLGVAATLGLIRHNREKRCRLYAQLPVSPLHVRLAFWCLAALFIFISTGVLVLVMMLGSNFPPADLAVYALLYFFHAAVIMAVLSIVSSNNLPLIPEEIRRRTIIYFFMAAVLTFLILFLLGLLISVYIHLLDDGEVKWWLLTVIMMVACAGLVTLDVRLFQRKEDYLG